MFNAIKSYEKKFNDCIADVYRKYLYLWKNYEVNAYNIFTTELENIDKEVYVRLILRKTGNIYNVNDVVNRYWKLVESKPNSLWTEYEESSYKKIIKGVIINLHKKNFIIQHSLQNQVDLKLISQLKICQIQKLLKLIPEGVDGLAKCKTKTAMLDWLQNLVTLHGEKKNHFTNKTITEIISDAYRKTVKTIDLKDFEFEYFVLNHEVAIFFKRLFLLNNLIIKSVQCTDLQNSISNLSDDSWQSKFMHKTIVDQLIINENRVLEYINISVYKDGLDLKSCEINLFDSIHELENYEQGLNEYEKLAALEDDLNNNSTIKKCILYLWNLTKQKLLEIPVLSITDILNYCQKSLELNIDLNNEVSSNSFFYSANNRIESSILIHFTHEYLYAKCLQKIVDRYTNLKNYQISNTLRAFIIASELPLNDNKSGNNLLRILIDLYGHSRKKLAAEWAKYAIKRISNMNPSIAFKVFTKCVSIFKYNKINNYMELILKNKRGNLADIFNVGVYKFLTSISTKSDIKIFLIIRKICDKAIPVIEFEAQPHKFSAGNNSKNYFLSSINSAPISVENFVLENELNFKNDQLKGAHVENSLFIEFLSIIFYPLCYNSYLDPHINAALISNLQTLPIDFENNWIEPRQRIIIEYITLLRNLTNVEFVIFISIISTFLYEIKFLYTNWEQDINHPDFFTPAHDFKETVTEAFKILSESPDSTDIADRLPNSYDDSIENTIKTKFVTPLRSSHKENNFNYQEKQNKQDNVQYTNRKNCLITQIPSPIQMNSSKKLFTPISSLRKKPKKNYVFQENNDSDESVKKQLNSKNPILGYNRKINLRIDQNAGLKEDFDEAVLERIIAGICYGLEIGVITSGLPENLRNVMYIYFARNSSYWKVGLPDLLICNTVKWKIAKANLRNFLVINKFFEEIQISENLLLCLNFIFHPTLKSELNKKYTNSSSETSNLSDKKNKSDAINNEKLSKNTTDYNKKFNIFDYFDFDEQTKLILRVLYTISQMLNLENLITYSLEVKGPGDSLSENQRLWLYTLNKYGLKSSIYKVHIKKKKKS